MKAAKAEYLAVSTQNLRSSRRLLVTGVSGGDDSWLDGSIVGMLLLLSHLGSLIARKMTAIARSATATEFIGTESVRDRASTNRSQSSDEDKVAAAVAEAIKPSRLGHWCLSSFWCNNNQSNRGAWEEHIEAEGYLSKINNFNQITALFDSKYCLCVSLLRLTEPLGGGAYSR